jgi:FkbM family methyltransferase
MTNSLTKTFNRYRRHLFEAVGSPRYSRPYRRGVGKKIESCLPDKGFFIEAGAVDGFCESNTYYLEKIRGWEGILVEPVPQFYQECLQERPRAKVYNCALVSFDYHEPYIEMLYGDVMSVTKGAFTSEDLEEKHVGLASRKLGFDTYSIKVPAKTIASILDEIKPEKVDYFSLDVEGFELEVLKGLDLNKYRPQYLQVECLEPEYLEKIEAFLENYYKSPEQISPIDFWFESRH